MTDFIEDIKAIANDALQAVDEIGAIKSYVYQITRTWTGSEPGDGTATEIKTQILPTPLIYDLSHDLRLVEGGIFKQGDLILRMISQYNYPNENDVNCFSNDSKIEKFYEIDDDLYQVINVRKDYATWNVHVRRLSDQTRY
jgi:hypothetical protein